MWFAENLTEYMSQEENKIKKGKSELVALVIGRITIKHFYFIYFTVTTDTLTLTISLENINWQFLKNVQ